MPPRRDHAQSTGAGLDPRPGTFPTEPPKPNLTWVPSSANVAPES